MSTQPEGELRESIRSVLEAALTPLFDRVNLSEKDRKDFFTPFENALIFHIEPHTAAAVRKALIRVLVFVENIEGVEDRWESEDETIKFIRGLLTETLGGKDE